jgi:replication factor A1
VAQSEIGTTLPPPETRLSRLRAGTDPVHVLARVVLAERREIVRKADGGRRPVVSGLLSDGTATVRFTWWDPPASGAWERGTVLRAFPATVREFRGRPELSFSFRTRFEEASDAELPKLSAADLPVRRVADLRDRDEGFRLDVRVVEVRAKSVSVGEERREVHEGLLADRSGRLAFTAWTDLRLRAGDAVRLVGGYVRAFRGRPQLVLDERTRVEPLADADLPTLEDVNRALPASLAELERAGGGDGVRLAGVVVALLPPSGIVQRCSACRRGLQKGVCRVHGLVEGTPDLRARPVVDDGTSTITVNLDREQTERLFGRTLDACLADLRARPDPNAIEEAIFEAFFGRRLAVRGRATRDDFGLTMFPTEADWEPASASVDTAGLRRRLREGPA